jgi:hypothetical protein
MSLLAILLLAPTSPAPAYSYSAPKANPHLEADTKVVSTKAKTLRLRTGERNKFKSDSGSWFITRGKNDLVFALCSTEDYP